MTPSRLRSLLSRSLGSLLLGGLIAATTDGGGQALADTTDTILAACDLPAKAALPDDGLCALFAERMAAAWPGRRVELAPEGAEATLRLVVLSAAPGRLEARIDWTGAPAGPAIGTAQADAPLDTAALAAFLDRLIAETPPP